MSEPQASLDLEPRWPIVATISIVFALSLLPGRVRAFPPWMVLVIIAVLVAPMAGLRLSSAKQRWLQIESIGTIVFVLLAGLGMLLDLKDLFVKMITPPNGITGIQLLNSSISLWGTNVLVFSVAYWRIDRGGNVARAKRMPGAPDWLFPREGVDDESMPPWRPTFVDYLFLAFCTAAAFTPAEAMPMTARAKLLMMAEGLIALVTILAVASRAIGLLGS
ncbi:MAG TPA: hypothetical protein VF783_03625 [Terriglobales bacterium]